MSLVSLMVRTVDVITPGVRTDAYGQPQPNWLTATEATTSGWLAPQSSFEDRDGRDATSTNLVLVLNAGTAITSHDRVRIEGIVYELIAEPLRMPTPRGEHHIECLLSLVQG